MIRLCAMASHFLRRDVLCVANNTSTIYQKVRIIGSVPFSLWNKSFPFCVSLSGRFSRAPRVWHFAWNGGSWRFSGVVRFYCFSCGCRHIFRCFCGYKYRRSVPDICSAWSAKTVHPGWSFSDVRWWLAHADGRRLWRRWKMWLSHFWYRKVFCNNKFCLVLLSRPKWATDLVFQFCTAIIMNHFLWNFYTIFPNYVNMLWCRG